MISAHNLTFLHNKRPIISEVNAEFNVGQVHVILGANGAGKSTLLRLLAGELKPTLGQIDIDGIPLSDLSVTQLAQIRAVLPQNPSLHFPLVVHHIVEMGTYPFPHLTALHIQQLVTECLNLTEIQHLAYRSYLTLSGGEQQRVHFARTLVQVLAPTDQPNKRFLLLDEPIANLDPRHQHHLLQLTKHMAYQHQIGIIITLHDVNLAAQYADQLFLLADKHIIAHGLSQEILTEDNLEKVYAQRPTVITHPLFADQRLILFH